jgi:hypothetical protein
MNFVPVATATSEVVEMETESVAGGAAAAAIAPVNTPSKRKTSLSSAKNASPKKAI